jgi:hypothetical protein
VRHNCTTTVKGHLNLDTQGHETWTGAATRFGRVSVVEVARLRLIECPIVEVGRQMAGGLDVAADIALERVVEEFDRIADELACLDLAPRDRLASCQPIRKVSWSG